MTLRSLMLLASLALAPTLACASKTPGADVIEPALELASTDRAAAAARLEAALDEAEGDEAAWLAVHAGEQRRLLGDDRDAKKHFKDASRSDAPRAARVGELGLALLDGGDTPDEDALKVLTGVAEGLAPSTLEAERFLVLALMSARTPDKDRTVQFVRKALRYAAVDPAVDARIRERLEAIASPRPETPGTPSDVDLLDRAVAAGDRDQVEALAARLAEGAEPDSDAAAIARYALRRVDLPPPRPVVGVLLPMSGKFKGVGGQVKQAITLGRQAGAPQVEFVFRDTGEDAESAVAALESLVFEERVLGVIGPLRTELAGDVARAANALRVPLVGLHQDVTAADDRPYVLDGLATPETQVDGLVDYVMGPRGMDAFAIFAPDNAYGQSAADAFTAAVEARGGTITVREHYDPEATDLIPFAEKLGRKDYEARASEFREVKRTIQEAGGDPRRAVLPPIIDFDAIFLPDNRRRVPVAAAGLAYEEFPVGQFQILKDGPTYPLLGLSGWNHPELVTTGGPYVRDSLFVDVWLPDAEGVQAFSQAFATEVGHPPNTLEAQAWTAARLVARAGRAEDRAAFLQALLDVQAEPRGTGAARFDAEARRIAHPVRILTLDKEGIRELDPEPPQDDAEGDTDAP